MRQKYTICREEKERRLSIKEYAILQRTPKGPGVLLEGEELFSFLGEETYGSANIVDSIEKGIDALIVTLRTESMYPIWPNVVRSAESVMGLYDLEGSGTVDLIFDDIEQLDQGKAMAD